MTLEEREEYYAEQRRLISANYRLTDDTTRMCRVCVSGQRVLGTGIRLCDTNTAFVTCGGTCDSFGRNDQ